MTVDSFSLCFVFMLDSLQADQVSHHGHLPVREVVVEAEGLI